MNNQLMKELGLANGLQLQLVQGDITKETVDAIVNAANSHLVHGGGVAAAIARAGGPEVQQQSSRWVKEHGPVAHDQAAITGGGDLPCRYIFHVVGPRWGEGDESKKLRSAVTAGLTAAANHDCQSLALPAISTGIFGYPVGQAAREIINAIRAFESDEAPRQIRLVIFDDKTLEPFRHYLDDLQDPA